MSKTAILILLLVLLAIAAYIYRFARAVGNITTVFDSARIKQVGLNNTTIAIRLNLDNPTNGGITVGQPFVILFFDGVEIGRSVPTAQRTQVPGNARTALPEIDVTISHLALLTKAPQLYGLLTQRGAVIKMKAQVTLEANRIKTTEEFDFSVSNPIAGLFSSEQSIAAGIAAGATSNNVVADPLAISPANA